MNRISYLLAAALTVGACAQKVETAPVVSEGELVDLEVCVPRIATKATGGDDARVGSYQVFVFRQNGTLEAGSYGQESSNVLKVSQGEKTVAVLTNCAKITDNLDLNGLRNKVVKLEDNTLSAVQMFGTESVTVNADASVTVEVTRLVAKIEISGIRNSITLDQYSNQPVVLKSIFLENVVGSRTLAGADANMVWYNQLGNKNQVPALLCDTFTGVEIAKGASLDVDRHFYCYPNSAEESNSATWSPRPTRLVVQVEIAGSDWYYPITIANVTANRHYTISGLNITRIGAENPDEVISSHNLTFNITVKDWEDEDMSEITI